MASGPRQPGESEMAYKRRLKTEEKEEKRQKRVKAQLPPGAVTIEGRITQVHAQMEDAIEDGDWEQALLTIISYTVHIEARVVDLEGQMANLLASLQMAAELEQKWDGKTEVIKPSTEIIMP